MHEPARTASPRILSPTLSSYAAHFLTLRPHSRRAQECSLRSKASPVRAFTDLAKLHYPIAPNLPRADVLLQMDHDTHLTPYPRLIIAEIAGTLVELPAPTLQGLVLP